MNHKLTATKLLDVLCCRGVRSQHLRLLKTGSVISVKEFPSRDCWSFSLLISFYIHSLPECRGGGWESLHIGFSGLCSFPVRLGHAQTQPASPVLCTSSCCMSFVALPSRLQELLTNELQSWLYKSPPALPL